MCGYTSTRGHALPVPLPAGTGRVGTTFYGYGLGTGVCYRVVHLNIRTSAIKVHTIAVNGSKTLIYNYKQVSNANVCLRVLLTVRIIFVIFVHCFLSSSSIF